MEMAIERDGAAPAIMPRGPVAPATQRQPEDGKARKRGRKGKRGGDGGAEDGERKRRGKRGKNEPTPEQLAQDIMPIESVQGSFIRRKDGLKNIMVQIAGVNDSLFTYDQKLRESESLAKALVAINRPASIIKLPKAIDANANLVHIDREIDILERELSSTNWDDSDPRAKRLVILRDLLRPEAEKEALAGDKFTHPTYLVLEFDDKTEDGAALREAAVLARRMEEAGHPSWICNREQIVEALMLYFTPNHVDTSLVKGRHISAKMLGGGR